MIIIIGYNSNFQSLVLDLQQQYYLGTWKCGFGESPPDLLSQKFLREAQLSVFGKALLVIKISAKVGESLRNNVEDWNKLHMWGKRKGTVSERFRKYNGRLRGEIYRWRVAINRDSARVILLGWLRWWVLESWSYKRTKLPSLYDQVYKSYKEVKNV